MNHSETVNTRLIAIGKLEKSPLNARRTVSKDGLDELKASILAHGLMQNLVVTSAPGGAYRVIAGGRRLAALRELQDEDKLPPDHAVPCQIVADDHAFEMSLAENTVRLAIHPADQYEAFAALIGKGRQTAAQVAARFGVEETLVLKRMNLGRVAPELLQAYREEEITLECLVAFAVTDDRAKQLAVYQSLQDWQKDNPRHIRACLTKTMVNAASPVAHFVGLDAYEAAGGTTRSDLFGEDTYLENPELLHVLAAEKLKRAEQELKAEGWGWVEVNPERDYQFTGQCGRIQPQPVDASQELLAELEQAKTEKDAICNEYEENEDESLQERYSELEETIEGIKEKIAACTRYDSEQMKTAGCYVCIDHAGNLGIDKGLVKPQDKKAAATASRDTTGAAKDKPKDGMSQTLKLDLEAYRLGAAQAEIAKHPAIAFDLLVFNAARYVLSMRPVFDGPNVHFQQNYGGAASKDACGFVRSQMEAIEKTLPLEWQKSDSEAEQFAVFRQLSPDQKQALLAFCVASTLQPKLAPEDDDRVTAYDGALVQTGAKVADYWRPTKANYLSRITRDRLLAIGREVLGDPWTQSRLKDKKGELVDQLDRAFSNPDQHGQTPEQVEKLKRWLPTGMEFAVAEATPRPVTERSAMAA